jgi:hypothetical protein
MSKAFYFILALAIAGGSLAITNPFDLPIVYAQVVETKGQNYDLIEDFTIGKAKWTSHPERIMINGEWENYFLTTDSQKIIFKSNSIGGFIYDIPTCSYTIYENGFDGNQIIPSVSSVATYLKDGTWQNMAVNLEQCTVNVSQNENGIFLTSTKNLIQTITNGTNANGTATTFNVETEKFVQELKVDIFGGIKETFKVWSESDEQLGISQTVHTGETITVGGNTIDIAQFNGQSFDKQFLEENQAQIFEIAQGLNYDFDLGFESLTGINIISESSFFNTTYKVNLDYADGGFVNYLEIDPTLTLSTVNTSGFVGDSGCNGSADNTGSALYVGNNVAGTNCIVSFIEYDVSAIPDNNLGITSAFFNYDVSNVWNGETIDMKVLTVDKSSLTNQQFYDNMKSTTTYPKFATVPHYSVATGFSEEFTNEFQTADITDNSLTLGFIPENSVFGGASDLMAIDSSTHELVITYTMPTVPQPPTNLSATDGLTIELSWTAPVDDGGSSITGYKLEHSTDNLTFSTLVANTGNTNTNYTHTTPTAGQLNYYKVYAINSIGTSTASNTASGLAGTPPNPPTGVTTSITNVNTNPLDVLVSYSSPTNVGSGTLTGFEIVRDGSVVATVGLVTSYTDTVPSAGTYTYLVRAISTHGTSSDSNTSNITTPNEPSAISDLSATANSDTAIALSWSSPNNGGSAITLYKIFQDAVQIDTTTNTSYTVTGLSPNTSYDFTVVASNNVGDSTASNTATQTTYLEITGHIDLTATTQGSTTQFVFSANVTAGTPTPTFSTFDIKENGITVASNISSPYNLKLTDTATHTYTIISTDNTHWNTPSINGTATATASYQADWQTDLLGSNEVAYNLSRANDQLNLVVNRDTGTSTWHLNCNYRTNTQILAGNNGTWYEVNSWYYDDTQSINDASIVYIDCYNDDLILQITSYSSDRTGGGIAVLNGFFEDWTGTPVALFFVLLVAGLFSGRTAPTGILLMLAIVGVMGFVGLLVIDEVVWAFILLVGVLGLFVGKRFL